MPSSKHGYAGRASAPHTLHTSSMQHIHLCPYLFDVKIVRHELRRCLNGDVCAMAADLPEAVKCDSVRRL